MFALFNKYFLIMMVISGGIVGFYDSRKYKKMGLDIRQRKARVVGIAAIIIGIVMFIFSKTF